MNYKVQCNKSTYIKIKRKHLIIMINRWHLVSHCLITFFISKKCFQFQTEQCFNVNVKRKHKKQQKIHSLSLNELSIYLFALHWKSARRFISRGINHRVSHSLCALPCKQPLHLDVWKCGPCLTTKPEVAMSLFEFYCLTKND